MTPQISTMAIEGQFQAAKWIKVQALLDLSELRSLLNLAPDSFLFPLSGLYGIDELDSFRDQFLVVYGSWIEELKRGGAPSELSLRKYGAICWTRSLESLWLQEVPGNRYLVKMREPVIQIQAHHMAYSTVDGEFRPMILSGDSIFWGLQFSFPQVYQNPKTGELLESGEGIHLELFREIRRWMREATIATPMIVEGKRINLPMRLGKSCISWINRHPQLIAKHLSVMENARVH